MNSYIILPKQFFAILYTGLCFCLLISQPQIAATQPFTNLYGTSTGEYFTKAIPGTQGIYVLGLENGMVATVTYTDLTGAWQWTHRMFINSVWFDGIIDQSSGNLLTVGCTLPLNSSNSSLIGEFDMNGYVCAKSLEEPGLELLSRITDNFDGTFSAVGLQTTVATQLDVVVFNLSPNCVVNYKKWFFSAANDLFYNDILTLGSAGADFLVAGQAGGNAVIYKMNSGGAFAGGVQGPGQFDYVDLELAGSDVLAVANSTSGGQPRIMRFDNSLLPKWEISVNGVSSLEGVVFAPNGDIFAVGTANVNGLNRAVVLKIDDSSGTPQLAWPGAAKYFENGETSYTGGHISLTPNGDVAFVDGRDGNPGSFGGTDAFLALTDGDLNSNCTLEAMASITIENTLFDGPAAIELLFYDVPIEQGEDGPLIDYGQVDGCAPCTNTAPNLNLTGYFPFNGNAHDSSPTGVNGIVTGATATIGHDAAPNSAYQFNGNSDWIDCGTNTRGVTNEVSVCTWVKTTETINGQWIAGQYDFSDDQGYLLSIGDSGGGNIGKAAFTGRDGSGFSVYHNSGFSQKAINDGEWHCVVGTAGNGQWSVYVDGINPVDGNSAAGSSSFTLAGISNPFVIGKNSDPAIPPLWMNGDIDNVLIYNRVLTLQEIYCFCAGTLPTEPCTCGTYSDITYRPEQGAPNIPAECGDTLIAQCDGLIPWTLGGNFLCDGNNCPDSTQMTWVLTAPDGSMSNGSIMADPGFGITIPPTDFDETGCYDLTLKAICGMDTCYCEFVIKVECDSCCLDFDAFCQNVENAVSISVDNDSCKATLSVGNFGDCNDYLEFVNWGDGQQDSGPIPTGGMAMHVYSGSGTYEVCYLAIELDDDGFICFEKYLCDTIELVCDKCCTDSLAFFTAAPNIQTFGTLGDCYLNFTAELDSCWQISYLWGDAPAVWDGPYGDNTSVSHTYTSEGTYNVCYRLEEVDETGVICWVYEKCEDVFVICPDSCATVPMDIVGWWPMEDTDGDIEVVDIIGAHNGTPLPGGVVGSPNGPFSVPGKVGNALHFVSPGNGHASVANASNLNFGTGSFSIDAWIYTNMGTQTEPIVDKLGNSNNGYSLSIQGTNPYYLTLVLGTSTSVNVLTGPPITTGEWNFVAVTVNPNAATFYVKNSTGFLQATTSVGAYNATNNSRPLLIGSNPFNPHWNIMIDELELFNRDLDSLELMEICEADSLGKCPPSTMIGCTCSTLSGNVSSGFTYGATGPAVYLFQPPAVLNDSCDQVTWDWGDGSMATVTTGATPVEHSFPGSGPTNVCMTVVRTQADGSTCTEEFCLEVTSIKNLDWENAISLFPNPTAGGLTLVFKGHLPSKGQLQILDLWGRVVASQNLTPGTQEKKLSITDLPSGIYFVKLLENGVPVWVEKVVKL